MILSRQESISDQLGEYALYYYAIRAESVLSTITELAVSEYYLGLYPLLWTYKMSFGAFDVSLHDAQRNAK